MRRKFTATVLFFICIAVLFAATGQSASMQGKEKMDKTAIIVASFGTTVPGGVVAISNITERVRQAFPQTEVRITFTSNIIRSVWRKRQAEPEKWLGQGIPKEVLFVENILSTIGHLQDEGYRNIIVQPTHIFYMEQSHDLDAYVKALNSISTMKSKWRPFNKIVMGRPALGMPGDLYSYHDDVEAAVKTLADDVAMAEKEDAILLYMGHGNEHWSTGIYSETQKKMRQEYPQVKTLIGVVDGSPALDDILDSLKTANTKKIILKPFMIVAGDHAVNDMAGPEAASWKSVLEAAGFEVNPIFTGLGSNNGFADIFVSHIRDIARDHGIALQ